ncbi:MAG: type II secretion system protein, partial [Acidobacteriota bacterium]|nr:type II secretion system protein [Acidobacteriota bacterium]
MKEPRIEPDRASPGGAADSPKRRRQRGFTLIELLVVMVIIGAGGALVGPRLFRNVGRSK